MSQFETYQSMVAHVYRPPVHVHHSRQQDIWEEQFQTLVWMQKLMDNSKQQAAVHTHAQHHTWSHA